MPPGAGALTNPQSSTCPGPMCRQPAEATGAGAAAHEGGTIISFSFSFHCKVLPRNWGVSSTCWTASCLFIPGLQSETCKLNIWGFAFVHTCGHAIAQLHVCLMSLYVWGVFLSSCAHAWYIHVLYSRYVDVHAKVCIITPALLD